MRFKPETGDAVSTERLLSTDIVDSLCVESIIPCKYAAVTGEDYPARLSGVNEDIIRREAARESSLLSEPIGEFGEIWSILSKNGAYQPVNEAIGDGHPDGGGRCES
jgi:hypothetical protein